MTSISPYRGPSSKDRGKSDQGISSTERFKGVILSCLDTGQQPPIVIVPAPGDLPEDPLAVLPQTLRPLLPSPQQANHPTPFPKTPTVEGEFPECATVLNQHYYKLFFCSVASHPTLLKHEIERGKHFEDNCVMLPKGKKRKKAYLRTTSLSPSLLIQDSARS